MHLTPELKMYIHLKSLKFRKTKQNKQKKSRFLFHPKICPRGPRRLEKSLQEIVRNLKGWISLSLEHKYSVIR